MTAPTAGESGRRSGRIFRLKKRVGAGAFGEVYLAEQDSGAGFKRPVALKVLKGGGLTSSQAARRMRDEARFLARLSHRNIVSVLDLVQLGDRWAVVMEYVEGADLDQVRRGLVQTQQEIPSVAALEIGAAICRALDAAYHTPNDAGVPMRVLHRDIKPSNVRMTKDGDVRVLDFGVAQGSLAAREAETRGDGWLGTERYMAPERILRTHEGPEGDVYATAATVAELLLLEPIGRTPVLKGEHEAFVAEKIAAIREKLVGPRMVIDNTVELLARGLAWAPADRPLCDGFGRELERLSRMLDGELLSDFCRRVVPTIPDVLGEKGEDVTGALTEMGANSSDQSDINTGGSGSLNWATGTATPAPVDGGTFVFPNDDEPDEAPSDGTVEHVEPDAPPAASGWTRVVAVVGMVVGALIIGLWLGGILEPKSEPADDSLTQVAKEGPGVEISGASKGAEAAVTSSAELVADADSAVSEIGVESTPKESENIETKQRPKSKEADKKAIAKVQPKPIVKEQKRTPETQPVTLVAESDAVIARAHVTVRGASMFSVRCPGLNSPAKGQGRSYIYVRGFNPGTCIVTATIGGVDYSDRVRVTEAQRKVECGVQAERFQCVASAG